MKQLVLLAIIAITTAQAQFYWSGGFNAQPQPGLFPAPPPPPRRTFIGDALRWKSDIVNRTASNFDAFFSKIPFIGGGQLSLGGGAQVAQASQMASQPPFIYIPVLPSSYSTNGSASVTLGGGSGAVPIPAPSAPTAPSTPTGALPTIPLTPGAAAAAGPVATPITAAPIFVPVPAPPAPPVTLATLGAAVAKLPLSTQSEFDTLDLKLKTDTSAKITLIGYLSTFNQPKADDTAKEMVKQIIVSTTWTKKPVWDVAAPKATEFDLSLTEIGNTLLLALYTTHPLDVKVDPKDPPTKKMLEDALK